MCLGVFVRGLDSEGADELPHFRNLILIRHLELYFDLIDTPIRLVMVCYSSHRHVLSRKWYPPAVKLVPW